jgi:polyhydroxybutyrate depolymerase
MQTIHRARRGGRTFRCLGIAMLATAGCGGTSGSAADAGHGQPVGASQSSLDSGTEPLEMTADEASTGASAPDATVSTEHEGGVLEAGEGGAGQGTSPQTCPMTPVPSAGDTNGTIQSGGLARTYILHVPTGYTGQSPVPLVLDFHFILGTAQEEEAVSGYATLADQEGFVVAFPNGIDNAWNIGPCCTTSRTVDDVGFARDLVNQLESTVCVDPKRVYAVVSRWGAA